MLSRTGLRLVEVAAGSSSTAAPWPCLGQVPWRLTWDLSPPQPAIPFLILVVLLPSNLVVTYIVAVAAGISVAATFLLPW